MKIKITFLLTWFGCFASILAQQQQDSIEGYSLKFQMTSIYQWHPEFAAKYSGQNSMLSEEQRALSLTSTLFLDVPLWKGATFTFNPEMSGGEGLSTAKGLGGFPNGETFRIGDHKPVVYMARMLIEQAFEFKNKARLTVVFGKFGLADYFDTNTYSHDPRTQFLNWSLMTHGAWDYAANTRGYTDGLYANYQWHQWQFRTSISALPTNANGPNLYFSFDKSYAINTEIERKVVFKNNDWGVIKCIGYRNLANMGSYQQANNVGQNPDITAVRQEGRTKYGIGLNAEYTHQESWGIFGRASYNDGKNETWAFTEIDQSASIGLSIKGKNWNRNQDFAGIALVANGLSKVHQEYQRLGGNGFMIGDGTINYGSEKILEAFYAFAVPKSNITLTPDYQFAINPGYNKDRGPISFLALRFHVEF